MKNNYTDLYFQWNNIFKKYSKKKLATIVFLSSHNIYISKCIHKAKIIDYRRAVKFSHGKLSSINKLSPPKHRSIKASDSCIYDIEQELCNLHYLAMKMPNLKNPIGPKAKNKCQNKKQLKHFLPQT